MKQLFLSSLFKNVSGLFEGFAGESLVGKRVAFIPTAANCENLGFHVRYTKKVLAKLGLVVDEVDLAAATGSLIASRLDEADYIYIGGGNTFFLLQEMERTGAGDVIRAHIDAGKLFIGESAGSIVLAPDIGYSRDMDHPEAAPHLGSYRGLGAIDFYPLPHVNDFTQRKAVKSIIADYGDELPLVPIGNSQVILVKGAEMQVVGRQGIR